MALAQSSSPYLSSIENYLVALPGGIIQLRDDRTKQQWTVDIPAFLIAKFAVTQEFYFEVTNENPSTFRGNKRPVETVSWHDAVRFCNLLSEKTGLQPCYLFNADTEEVTFDSQAEGFRLPTEAEWEYACKAGTTGIRYGVLNDIAWYKDNAENSTHDVGLKAPNAWGLYDMLGNVWEWCSDVYDETVYGSYRIFRGGGWCDTARGCLATNRRRSHPSAFKIDDLGFWIAQNQAQ